MIIVEDVHKRYQTDHGASKWILKGVSFTIPPKVNVGLVGRNGAGKSTLLRIIGGVDQPTHGKIERRCRVSWPMGFGGGLQSTLTGRQNAKFVCRIHGHEDDIPARLAYIQNFAEIGDAFDEPIKSYSSGMKARLQFALSLAFDFDVYISDEVTATGDAAFRNKAAAAFKKLADHAGLIMVSHGEGTLRQFCSAGIYLYDGQAYWFDNIDDAINAYKETELKGQKAVKLAQPLEKEKLKREQRKKLKNSLRLLEEGKKGNPATVGHEEGLQLIRRARLRLGMSLVSENQIIRRGYTLQPNSTPILYKRRPTNGRRIALYDLISQCVKVQSNSVG